VELYGSFCFDPDCLERVRSLALAGARAPRTTPPPGGGMAGGMRPATEKEPAG
jgi:hypothetical protein